MDTVTIHTDSPIKNIEKACRIVAETIMLVGKSIKSGSNTLELDKIAEAEAKATAKAALLSKLGITAEEARLLFP